MTPKKHKEIKTALNTVMNDAGDFIGQLAARWNHEREYEDFADYAERMKAIALPKMLTFVKATKRPFGFVVSIADCPTKIQFYATSRDYGWKTVKK